MARLRASWRTSLPVVQQPRNPQSESIARSPYHSWAGYRALPSSRFETLALSSAAELVGVARPRCAGSVTRESDISNGENGDISIGRLQPLSTRNLEVEQDRASLVLPHHPDLARPSAHQPCGRRGSDCRDHDDERADSGLRAGPAALCEGDQD